MPGRRRLRLGEQLRRELSVKIGSLRDPDVGPVTVMGVEVTADLWLARVFVETHGSAADQARTLEALRRSAPFLRSRLARELRIRRMPELRFMRDSSGETGRRIEAILREVLPEDTSQDPASDVSGPATPKAGDDS